MAGTKGPGARWDSFVVRILREEEGTSWKGWVQHAGSSESTSFQDVDSLLVFIEARTGALRTEKQQGLK